MTNGNDFGKMQGLRLSLNGTLMIICSCRGKSDRDINKLIDNGATTLRDLQRCGVGDQCGSCHFALRGLLARAAAAAGQEASVVAVEQTLLSAPAQT